MSDPIEISPCESDMTRDPIQNLLVKSDHDRGINPTPAHKLAYKANVKH